MFVTFSDKVFPDLSIFNFGVSKALSIYDLYISYSFNMDVHCYTFGWIFGYKIFELVIWYLISLHGSSSQLVGNSWFSVADISHHYNSFDRVLNLLILNGWWKMWGKLDYNEELSKDFSIFLILYIQLILVCLGQIKCLFKFY